jgi:hypothetical protein
MDEHVRAAMHVRDVRGRRLGSIGVVAIDRFSLEREAGEPLWISIDAVLNLGFGTVTLICEAAALGEHEVPAPNA